MTLRDERAASMLLQLAAKYIAEEAGRTTLITPTRALYGSDKKHVTIFVSVYPKEQLENALAFLKRHKDLFRDYLKKHGRFSILPYITFEFDYGEENRQHLEEISREI